MRHYGIQSHFNAVVALDVLQQVRAYGFTHARIDAQTCDHETMLRMVNDALVCGLTPLVIVSDLTRLAEIPAGTMVEWTNEPDGDIAPRRYRSLLDEACRVAMEHGLELWAPAISNLDEDSLKWLNDVRDAGGGWPDGLKGISAHSYGPFPHRGFRTREGEVKWLIAACVGLPWIITECGEASCEGVSEQEQADFARAEWAFWIAQGAQAVYWFQLNDGPHDVREHRYGIRRFDGSWKPVAETVLQP